MPTWAVQVGAVVLGLMALGFFVFASAYYARNRRLALGARDRGRAEAAEAQRAGVGSRAVVDTGDAVVGSPPGGRGSSDEE